MVKPIPDGYHTVTPYLCVNDGAAAIDFYKRALNAQELFRMQSPDGRVAHAELQIGESRVMLAGEFPEMNFRSPKTLGGSAIMMHLYVDDCDAWFNRAVEAGAKVTRPLADQFYGDRGGMVEDPFGHSWYLATHVEDVSEEELAERAKKERG